MRRHPLLSLVSPLLLRSFLFLAALLAAIFSLAAPVRASSGGLAAPEDLVVEVVQDGIVISWSGDAPQYIVQYTLYRSTSVLWQEAAAVDAPISSAVSLESPGVTYSFYDQSALAGESYTYWVVGENDAESIRFGPYYSTQTYVVFLPLLARS